MIFYINILSGFCHFVLVLFMVLYMQKKKKKKIKVWGKLDVYVKVSCF